LLALGAAAHGLLNFRWRSSTSHWRSSHSCLVTDRHFARLGIDRVDARARRARDKFVPLEALFRVRGRIVDNPSLGTQACRRAMKENRGHAILSARRRKLLLT
jgi:hypothetical protein